MRRHYQKSLLSPAPKWKAKGGNLDFSAILKIIILIIIENGGRSLSECQTVSKVRTNIECFLQVKLDFVGQVLTDNYQ